MSVNHRKGQYHMTSSQHSLEMNRVAALKRLTIPELKGLLLGENSKPTISLLPFSQEGIHPLSAHYRLDAAQI